MFSADSYLIDFVGQNWVFLGLLIGLLKVLAKRSKNNIDDSILSYLGEALSGFRRDKSDQENPE